MAVLAEAISVVVRADRLLAVYPGGWDAFVANVPNASMCADDELVRVGFMAPDDVRVYVAQLEQHGLVHLQAGEAQDLVVVDQQRGPTVRCSWIEFGHIELDDPAKRVAACRLRNSSQSTLVTPDGWEFEGSLSQSFGFAPTEQFAKGLTFLRHESGTDVYWSDLLQREVYIGRTHQELER